MATRIGALGSFTAPEITPEHERRAREFEANERREAWRQRLQVAGIPTRFHSARLADCPGPVRAYAEAFTAETDRGLLLTGPYGSGKTHAACAVLATMARDFPVVFAPMTDLVAQAQTSRKVRVQPRNDIKRPGVGTRARKTCQIQRTTSGKLGSERECML